MSSNRSAFEWRRLFAWNNFRAALSGSMLEQERSELRALHDSVRSAYERSAYSKEYAVLDFVDALVEEAISRANIELPSGLTTGLKEVVYRLTKEDPVMFWMPEFPAELTIDSSTALRAVLNAKFRFLSEPARMEDIWREKVIRIIEGFLGYLPRTPEGDQFSVAVLDVCDVPEIVQRVIATIYDDDVVDARLFYAIRERFERNIAFASGMTLVEAKQKQNKVITPTESTKPSADIVSSYLGGTAFEDLFSPQLSFSLPETVRFAHHWIVAPPGSGKTTLLQTLIAADFDLVADNRASIVVMESKRDLIKAIEGLAVFGRSGKLDGRLVLVDVEDVEYPIALNLFDVGLDKAEALAPLEREVIYNSSVSLLEYVFRALLGAELTSRQNTLFSFTLQLLLQIPGATLDTFIELMQRGGLDQYASYVSQLDADAQSFFRLKFNDDKLQETKNQIVDRLFAIKRIRVLGRMFSAPKTKLDFFNEMASGKVILINTAKSVLGEEGVEIVGRFMIAMILHAAQRRQLLPEGQRLPTFVYIDECHDIIRRDEKITTILDQARGMRVAMILAHQRLGQMTDPVLDALYGSTAIKFATKVSGATALAQHMGTNAAFIQNQPDHHFAAFIPGIGSRAISLKVPFTDLTKEDRLSTAETNRLRAANRTRVCFDIEDHRAASAVKAEPPPAPQPQPTPPERGGKRSKW